MDKIKINSLGAVAQPEETYFQIGDASVLIKRGIPYEEMLDMIQFCIDFIINDRPFVSAPLKQIVKDFALIGFYTNLDISFMTENTEMSEIYAEYDLITAHKVMEQIRAIVDPQQLEFFDRTLDETLESIAQYRNSAMGIVDNLSASARGSMADMQGALSFLQDPAKEKQVGELLKLAEEIQG